MSINPSKYIKLTTEPWTGDGIQQPIQSLTFQDIPTNPATGYVTLTEAGNKLLVNGVEIAGSGTSEVLSITAAPGSAITVSPTTGAVQIGVTGGGGGGGGVTSITGAGNLQITPPSPPQSNITIACNSTGYIPSITTSSFDLVIDPPSGRGVVNINTNSDISTPVLTNTFIGKPSNLTPLTLNMALGFQGVYLLEVIVVSNNADNVRFGYNCLFRYTSGQGYLTNENLIHTSPTVKLAIAYTLPNTGDDNIYMYFIGMANDPGMSITTNVYRIL